MSYKILITEPIAAEAMEFLKNNRYEVKLASDISEANLILEAEDCDAILVRMAVITENIMRAGNKLKVISKFGVGVDNIDIETASKLGIQVTNSPESNKNTVAEYTLGLILALSKHFFLYDRELKTGNFQIRTTLGFDVHGKVLGIVGTGSIGRLVAEKAAAGFGMKVIAYQRHPNLKSTDEIQCTDNLDYLLKNSDYVSLHVPLNDSTKKLLGKREFSLMKPDAFLINTARGEVIDNSALFSALSENKIAGAAIDVFEGEVPAKDNPLFKLHNVIVTPHTAAHTHEAVKRMSMHSALGVHEVLSGKAPSWPVNKIKK